MARSAPPGHRSPSPPARAAPVPSREPTPLVGPAPGRYVLAEELGRGGVGSVVKARDRDIGRNVAIKILLDVHRGDREMMDRLVEEAQIGGQLQHPGVVPVYDLGLLGPEQPYFAMKLVEGQTLEEILAARGDPSEGRLRLLAIFEQVCQTLAYAHSRGVIHRDLKPSNIMVGAFGEVQVMDWGLAKVIGLRGEAAVAASPPDSRPHPATSSEPSLDPVPGLAAAAETPALRTLRSHGDVRRSIPGSILGTPAYIPPEQARGEVADLDERSDVFGLGAILCEILTGLPPYRGSTPGEVVREARDGDLSDAHRRLDGCGADPDVVRLARQCLSSGLELRPRDAGEVALRIRSYLESLEARARTLEVRAARARFRFALAAIVLVATVAGGSAAFLLERSARERAAEGTRTVIGSVEEAELLRRSARSSPSGDVAEWEAALREARRAVELSSPIVDPTVAARALSLRAEIETELRDRRTAARLERLREEVSGLLDQLDESREDYGGAAFDELVASTAAGIDDGFRAAFRDYGIDIELLDREEAAGRIRQSGVARDLILGLDQWSSLDASGVLGGPELRDRLFDVAQLSDDDIWSYQLRRAKHERDQETLVLLSQDAKILTAAPSTLESLSRTFLDMGNSVRAERILRDAQWAHPGDFWLNARLGQLLTARGRAPEALRFLTAAVSIRPRLGQGYHLLGRAMLAAGNASEGVRLLLRDIELDPASGRSYHRLFRLLDEESSRAQRPPIRPIVEALEDLARSGREYHRDACLRLLAKSLFREGERTAAILVLEESLRVPGAQRGVFPTRRGDASHAKLLEEYRRAVLPDLVSFASIDARAREVRAGAGGGGRTADAAELRGALASSLERARALGSEVLRDYAEACLLEESGEPARAADLLARVIEREGSFPEPWLRRARCLRAAGEAGAAEGELRAALREPRLRYAAVWDLWLAVSMADLARGPADLLARMPSATGVPARNVGRFLVPADADADVRWLLERLRAREPIRIRCGGDDWVGPRGEVWSRDRFFTVGGTRYVIGRTARSRDISGTDRDPVYRAERWFTRGAELPGYRIPLPPGRWRVVLHFAEIYEPASDPARGFRRAFDVRIEGVAVLEGFEPGASGFAAAEIRSFEVAVDDGILDLEFVHRIENPKISGIEVEAAEPATASGR